MEPLLNILTCGIRAVKTTDGDKVHKKMEEFILYLFSVLHFLNMTEVINSAFSISSCKALLIRQIVQTSFEK